MTSFSTRNFLFAALLVAAAICPTYKALAATACATVKIVIEQRVTLERQAFEATLTVDNGLAVDLENFVVNVWMRREAATSFFSLDTVGDPPLDFFRENSLELFFFTAVSGQEVTKITSGGRNVYAYRLIPTGNAALTADGTRYEVGADITYKPGGGAEESLKVEPDSILVKPLPKLSLEYFLPKSVIANNPNTAVFEPSVPFDLGLRVINSGIGNAVNLKVESFQPRIEDNDAGLLADFRLLDSYVNGKLSPDGLTVNFGELLSGHAESATWTMISSLYGRLVEARATFTHSDELGGALTSLIDSTSVFRLVGKVDSNNDGIPDFLSVGGGSEGHQYNEEAFHLKITGSGAVDFLNLHPSGLQGGASRTLNVINLSPFASTSTVSGDNRILVTLDYTSGGQGDTSYSFTRIPDPRMGRYEIASVIRSDDHALRRANFSLKTEIRELSDGSLDISGFDHFIDIFDIGNVDGALNYTVYYGERIRANNAPKILPLPKLSLREGDGVTFLIEAVDLEGDPIQLTSPNRPIDENADFVDHGDGTATFTWIAKPGLTPFVVVATDGELSSSASTTFNVVATTEDRLAAWLAQFGLEDADLSQDYSRDGFNLLLEYVLNLNPIEKSTQGLPRVYVEEVQGEAYLVLECDVLTEVANDPTGLIRLSAVVADSSTASPELWIPLEVAPTSQLSPVPGMTTLRWKDPHPLSDVPRFIRLKATQELE